MTTTFPGAIDAFPRPAPATARNAAGLNLSGVIDNLSDALEAVEAKLGHGAGTPPTAGTVLRGTGVGQSGFGVIQRSEIAAGATSAIWSVGATTASPSTTATSPGLLPDMTLTITTAGFPVWFLFDATFAHSALGNVTYFDLYLDAGLMLRRTMSTLGTALNAQVALSHFGALAADTYTIQIRWSVSAGSASCYGTERRLTIVELRR